MTKDEFFQGFLAALGSLGETQIVTSGDRHHRAFATAVAELERARDEQQPGADRVPRVFRASLFTGRYSQLDEALAALQRVGLLRGVNPFYRSVDIALDEEHAEKLLRAFDTCERDILRRMAQSFIGTQDAKPLPEERPEPLNAAHERP